MFPVVAKIVRVGEAGDPRSQEAAQGQLGLVSDVVDGPRIPILAAGDVEGVEVAAMPTHGGLDGLMQVRQRHGSGQQETAPDRWLNVAQRHLQDDDGPASAAFGGGLGHGSRLRHSRRR